VESTPPKNMPRASSPRTISTMNLSAA
jgi:hypothetical protein